MNIRNSTSPAAYKGMSSEELRSTFLFDSLFTPGNLFLEYVETDRAIIGGAVPINKPLVLESSKKEMAAEYFTERRELGIINIGGTGSVLTDGVSRVMNHRDGLYVGRGTKEVIFSSAAPSDPAAFYLVSYPAHASHPTTVIPAASALKAPLGSPKDANVRVINKYIHMDGAKSCQLVMGLTELAEGNVWNTMPPHTHVRRSEIYMYFAMSPDSMVVHLMGEPQSTRNLIIRNREAVVSPSWSIHAGVGTQAYSFIWAMGGENQAFDDMDQVKIPELL